LAVDLNVVFALRQIVVKLLCQKLCHRRLKLGRLALNVLDWEPELLLTEMKLVVALLRPLPKLACCTTVLRELIPIYSRYIVPVQVSLEVFRVCAAANDPVEVSCHPPRGYIQNDLDTVLAIVNRDYFLNDTGYL
jgi:hypothetical protein